MAISTRRPLAWAAAAACALLLCGCAPAASPAPTASAPAGSAASALGTWGDKDNPPFITFDENDAMSGNDGCNGFSGKWEQSGDRILFADVAMTLKACEGVDQWLTKARSAVVQGQTLSVRDENDKQIGSLPRS